MAQKAGKRTVEQALRRERALQLRLAGGRYASIGQALGVSTVAAWRHVQRALEEIRERTAEATEQLREIELARLDALQLGLWDRRVGNPRVVDSLLRIAERRARLLGLDALDPSTIIVPAGEIEYRAVYADPESVAVYGSGPTNGKTNPAAVSLVPTPVDGRSGA